MREFFFRVFDGLLRWLKALRTEVASESVAVQPTTVDRCECFIPQAFDAAWYKQKYSRDIGKVEDVWSHYLHVGWRLNFNPCEFFWGDWYLEKNPDVAASGMNPLQHFEQFGAAELRNPSPLFDTGWYVRAYSIDTAKISPLAHFLRLGRGLGFVPRADMAAKSFIRGSTIGGHASIALDEIAWKLTNAGQNALHQAVLSTGRAYHTSEGLEIAEQSFLQDIGREMQHQGIVHAARPYSTTFNDIIIIPGSASLAKGSVVINDELANSPANSSIKLGDRTWRRGDEILLKYTVGVNPRIKTGMHLFKEYEQNYFHFVAEILPKLIAFEKLELDVSIPLLMSADLDERLYQLVELLKHPSRKVLKLDRNVPYFVEKLFYISDLSLVRDVYDRPPVKSDTYLPAQLLNMIADRALNKVDITRNTRRRRRLFLTRQGKRRKIVNEPEIIDALIAEDFEVIDLSNLSVRSQIELFSSAEIVVGGTGAGFTNLLWCRPGTKAVILYPDHPYSNTTFWDRIGAARQLNIRYISGARAYVETGIYAMHDDFTIDLRQLDGLL